MAAGSSHENQTQHLILAAEREAQMVSAFARLLIITIAGAVFLLSGGINLPVAPVVLTYMGSYAVVSVASAVFSLKRLFNPKLSLLFTAIDGIALALLIGFALRVTGSPLALHGAVPGFVFFFSILILATMRYTVGPVLVAFFSFAGTWLVFSNLTGGSTLPPETGPGPWFFFGTVQNAARWGFVAIATLLCLLAVYRRRKTLEAAIASANKSANLSRYLPDRVADLVADQGIDALSTGHQQQAAVLFIDIRGFTGISENLPPAEVSTLLSGFRSIVSDEVEAEDGIVDKFIGDAVMAVFGVPEGAPDNEKRAVRCALSVLARIEDWNGKRHGAGLSGIRVTIGVHCGEVFAGAVGTENRMEFTVLGDTVNIAARLQEAAKTVDSGLVVSKTLLDRTGLAVGDQADWMPMAETTIRGRKDSISLFRYAGSHENTGLQDSIG